MVNNAQRVMDVSDIRLRSNTSEEGRQLSMTVNISWNYHTMYLDRIYKDQCV
jgi:hypothetical protein